MNRKTQTKKQLEQSISQLQATQQQIVKGVNQSLQNLDKQLGNLQEMVGALIRVVGQEKVQEEVASARREALEKNSEAEQAQINDALEKNLIQESDTIDDDDSIVCLQVKGAEGNIKAPSKIFRSVGSFDEQYKVLVKSLKIGQAVDYPSDLNDGIEGDTICLLKVYQKVVKTPEEMAELVKQAQEQASE